MKVSVVCPQGNAGPALANQDTKQQQPWLTPPCRCKNNPNKSAKSRWTKRRHEHQHLQSTTPKLAKDAIRTKATISCVSGPVSTTHSCSRCCCCGSPCFAAPPLPSSPPPAESIMAVVSVSHNHTALPIVSSFFFSLRARPKDYRIVENTPYDPSFLRSGISRAATYRTERE